MLLKAVEGDLESLFSRGGHHLLLEEGKESLLPFNHNNGSQPWLHNRIT